MFEISIKSHFCGAHRLKGYAGLCANLHGHNWEVEVFLRGAKLNHLGMLLDFKHVKTALRVILKKIDHQNLNALPILKKTNPTAENIAKFIFDELAQKFKSNPPQRGRSLRAGYRLDRVRISETPGTAAYYSEGK